MVISNGIQSISNHADQEMENRNPKIEAVTPGGWPIIEGWKPSLFDSIPNEDYLDGPRLQFKSTAVGKYLYAESGGGSRVAANSTGSDCHWETISSCRINERVFNFRVANEQFVGLDSGGDGVDLVATSRAAGASENFEIVRDPDDPSRVKIKAFNGFFLQVRTKEQVTADYDQCDESNVWGDENPSVFIMTFTQKLEGEIQVTNGYGPKKASEVRRLPGSKIALLFLFLCSHIASMSSTEEIQDPFPRLPTVTGHYLPDDGKQGLYHSIGGTWVPEWAIIPVILIIVVAILVVVYFYCKNPIPLRCRCGDMELAVMGEPATAGETST